MIRMIDLRTARVGYVPYAEDLFGPGDRRRFPFYANARQISFELADPKKDYDVVILSSQADISVWHRYQRGKLIYDLIDSYLSVPKKSIKGNLRGVFKFLAGQSKYLQINHWRAIELMCTRANAVVCTTQEQEFMIRKYCNNVHKILDFHEELAFKRKVDYKVEDVFRIVWEGLPQTIGAFKYIKSSLEKISSKYNIQIHIVTDRNYFKYLRRFVKRDALLDIQKIIPNIHFHSWRLENLSEIICSCDLAIIPLKMDDPFSIGKPENKLLLFWRMGMPVVVSSSPAYFRAMKEAGLNCTAKNESEWLLLLEYFIINERARQNAGRAGYDYVNQKNTKIFNLSKWDGVFSSLEFSID